MVITKLILWPIILQNTGLEKGQWIFIECPKELKGQVQDVKGADHDQG